MRVLGDIRLSSKTSWIAFPTKRTNPKRIMKSRKDKINILFLILIVLVLMLLMIGIITMIALDATLLIVAGFIATAAVVVFVIRENHKIKAEEQYYNEFMKKLNDPEYGKH